MTPIRQAVDQALRRAVGHDIRVAAAHRIIGLVVATDDSHAIAEMVVREIEERERAWTMLIFEVRVANDA